MNCNSEKCEKAIGNVEENLEILQEEKYTKRDLVHVFENS